MGMGKTYIWTGQVYSSGSVGICVFCLRVNTVIENCALLGCYGASSCNFLSTLRDGLSVPFPGVLDSWSLNLVPIGCPETSIKNYHYWLRNAPEERSSHLLRGGSLKSRIVLLLSLVYRLLKLRTICNVGVISTEHLTNCGQFKETVAMIGHVFDRTYMSSPLGQLLASSIAETKADSFEQSCYCCLLAAKPNRPMRWIKVQKCGSSKSIVPSSELPHLILSFRGTLAATRT